MLILIATDGTPAAMRALERVPDLTPVADREAIVLRVRTRAEEPVLVQADDAIELVPGDQEVATTEAVMAARDMLVARGIPTRVMVRESHDAAREILAVAEEERVDLIVVGTRHLSALARLLVGSVSADLATHAHIPLLIVP